MQYKITVAGVLRFIIAIELVLASLLYVIYLPHRYFSECSDGTIPSNPTLLKTLCPVPSFAAQPHPIFFIVVDMLIVTAILYTAYSAYEYLRTKKRA